MATLSGLAPAKVNLFLHVGPVEADGFHPLASLVAFADIGDRITVSAADTLSLEVIGPFASGLAGDDNLVLRALRVLGHVAGLGEPTVAVTLDKQLPVAAGLGGGSSDAGAALRLTRDLLGLTLGDDDLAAVAAEIGADGPMCLHARAAWAEGRGDRLTFEPRLPPLPAVLVNPGVLSPTGRVYGAYDAGPPATADLPASPDWSVGGVARWLERQRNDLEAPAIMSSPAIGEALAVARDLPDVILARMSGSGATVFALFETPAQAASAAASLAAARPGWWVRPTILS